MSEPIGAQEAAKLLGRTALYRHFDAQGALLYVGVSLNPFMRLRGHRLRSSWEQRISRISIEWFDTRKQALEAEFFAIRAEAPLHNIDMNGPMVHCRPLDQMPEHDLALVQDRYDKAEIQRLKRLAAPRKPRKQKRAPVTLDDMRAALATVGRRR